MTTEEIIDNSSDYIYAKFIMTSVVSVKQHKTLLDKTAQYHNIKLRLDVSENLDRNFYVDEEEIPTPAGISAMLENLSASMTLVLKAAAKAGMNDGKLLSQIIKDLENGFVDLREVEVSHFHEK